MPRINARTPRTASHARLITTTTTRPNTVTGNGAPAYTRDAKGELFLLATTTYWGEENFYESGKDRSRRLVDLVHRVAVDDFIWLSKFAHWLRTAGNIRTVSIVIAAEAVKARLDAGLTEAVCSAPDRCPEHGSWTKKFSFAKKPSLANLVRGEHHTHRKLVDSVLQRADEPGELIAYWLSTYGRSKPIPIAIKRGVADAIARLWNEYSFLKYDSEAKTVRFGDVVDLTQPAYHRPEMRRTGQYELLGYALAKRHNRDEIIIPPVLSIIRNRVRLMGLPVDTRRKTLLSEFGPMMLRQAGMTWESVAGWLQGPMDGRVWETLIPTMGYMALLRSLRNFDQAGISDEIAQTVADRIADPDQVVKSRQMPYRFLSAHLNTDSLRWASALDTALTYSTQNIPSFSGRTLVLVDTSGSMEAPMSLKSKISRVQAGAMFGVALAVQGDAVDLYGFASHAFQHKVNRGASLLRETERFCARVGEVGHGTMLAAALNQAYDGHNRIIVVSDLQTTDYLTRSADRSLSGHTYYSPFRLPSGVNFFGFNTAGGASSPIDGKPGMYEMGGLTDRTFANILSIEHGQSERWPWDLATDTAA